MVMRQQNAAVNTTLLNVTRYTECAVTPQDNLLYPPHALGGVWQWPWTDHASSAADRRVSCVVRLIGSTQRRCRQLRPLHYSCCCRDQTDALPDDTRTPCTTHTYIQYMYTAQLSLADCVINQRLNYFITRTSWSFTELTPVRLTNHARTSINSR